jgi:2-polyprenyl-3-methyl-5-hydroxy-6-metoxy-1,4-benzoquinol methylase
VTASTFAREVAQGQRFEFGENWARFLGVLGAHRIAEAETSLRELLSIADLRGRNFVDVGSGSGLFSLAAVRLGAAHVHSLDVDPSSVACTRELRRRYAPDTSHWTIEEASVLDRAHLEKLGQFDVVYSWGVLHHTGQMWQGLNNATMLVAAGGLLALAIYNDQGAASRRWLRVKQQYNRGGLSRAAVLVRHIGGDVLWNLCADLRHARNPLRRYRSYSSARGMSWWHDRIDWLGGLPFEVASVEAVRDFCAGRGFELVRTVSVGTGSGNNQFVFVRS